MKRKILLTVALSFCLTLMLGFGSSALAAQNKIDVIYDSSPIIFDVQPQSLNGRTMVPFRQIFETLGYDVDWNEATKTVTAKSKEGGDTITLKLGSTNITMNEKTVQSDVPLITKNNRTLVPVRIVSELSGKDVLWDDYGPAVMIYSKLGEEATRQAQSSNQSLAVGDGKLFFSDYNQKSAKSTLIQLDLASGDSTKTALADPEFNGLQWAGDKLFIEGVEDFYMYSPADSSVQTYEFQPNAWIYNGYFYDNAIYGAHCYNLKSGQRTIRSQDFAKLNPVDNQVSLLDDEMPVKSGYIIKNGKIFNKGAVEDIVTGKVTYVDDKFKDNENRYVDYYYDEEFGNEYSGVVAQAVHGDYYYCAYITVNYDYWTETSHIIRYNYKTGEAKELSPLLHTEICDIAVTDNSIYYTTYYDQIYRADLNGNHAVPLAESYFTPREITVYGNSIIYMNYDYDTGCNVIKALNTDGTNHHTLYKLQGSYPYHYYDGMGAEDEY